MAPTHTHGGVSMAGGRPIGLLALHALGGVVMLSAAAVLFAQVALLATRSDEEVIELVKAGTKMERDKAEPGPTERPLTDEEIDRKVEERKAEFLERMRNDPRAKQILVIKTVVGVLLVVLALGLFLGLRRLSRILAVVMGVLLLISALVTWSETAQALALYKYLRLASAPLLRFVDTALLAVLPAALLFCILTVILPPPRRTPDVPETD